MVDINNNNAGNISDAHRFGSVLEELNNIGGQLIQFSIPPVAKTARWLDKSHHITPS